MPCRRSARWAGKAAVPGRARALATRTRPWRLRGALDSPGMTGRSLNVNGAIPNLDGSGFNDRAQSAIIHSGTWQFCADADYRGSCEGLGPGQWSNLGGVTGRVSSLRPVPGGGGGGGPAPGPGGGWGGGRTRVVLYEGSNFPGRSFTVNKDVVMNLGTTGFNDRASSMRVERGYWMFCTDAKFVGECRTFGRATIRRCRGSPTGSRRAGAFPTTIRTSAAEVAQLKRKVMHGGSSTTSRACAAS